MLWQPEERPTSLNEVPPLGTWQPFIQLKIGVIPGWYGLEVGQWRHTRLKNWRHIRRCTSFSTIIPENAFLIICQKMVLTWIFWVSCIGINIWNWSLLEWHILLTFSFWNVTATGYWLCNLSALTYVSCLFMGIIPGIDPPGIYVSPCDLLVHIKYLKHKSLLNYI
jgi:hypothetical protein